MQVGVTFREEQLTLEIPEDRLIGQWQGPAGVAPEDVERLVVEALEHPRQYPPLRQAVVPGDQVVLALDAREPHTSAVLRGVCEVLRKAGVAPASITVLSSLGLPPGGAPLQLPDDVSLVVHDPSDRNELAYLASTKSGRRVYLNKLLTDADFVLPIGRLGVDDVLGTRGPWSTLYPSLSDLETLQAFQGWATEDNRSHEQPSQGLSESIEAAWLLGSQFQLGIVPGVNGPVEVVAGLDSAVREQGAEALNRSWTFRAETRAELVVAGIGRSGLPTTLEDLANGLSTAARLVERGGRIVILSRAEGELGPAFQKLVAVDNPRVALKALRGHESDPDYAAARALASALAWADVYLLSALKADDVEDLAMVPMERAEEARRLVATSRSCVVLSQAELTAVNVLDETTDSTEN